jgi:hypothetical protein
MLYAKTLLTNHRYAECDALLSRLAIIPFEGATIGRELYREAKLMQSVAAFHRRDYKKALGWIGQARQWPENLGVGEPYASEEDLRLEDWMSYRCYKALHRDGDAQQALERIRVFKPRVDNTVANFIASNNIISEWAAGMDNAGGDKNGGDTIHGEDANARILRALTAQH